MDRVLSICFLVFFTELPANELPLKKTEFVSVENLANVLPSDWAQFYFVHLKTLAIQRDSFSCGYHALFNAVAIDRALQDSYNLDASLKKHLSDKQLFEYVHDMAKTQVKQEKPLNGVEITQIADKLNLGSRITPLFYTDKNELMIPNLYASVQHPIHMPRNEIEQLLHQKRTSLVQERINGCMCSIKKKNWHAGHFICNVGNHWMLFTIVSDWYANPKMYIIGSWNEPLNATIKKFAYDLLGCFEKAGRN